MRRCVLLLGLLLAGCYGQTDPATDVTQSGATLHGHGTTNNGPADVWFEYWPTAAIAQRKLTPERRIPGDVTAPFTEPVSGLAANTHYSFRLCGRDVGGPAACAPVRSFTTGQDFVRGNGYGAIQIGIYEAFDVEAFNGPQGSGPSGRAFAQWADPYPGVVLSYGSRTTPNTTCVAVRGREAVVGFMTPASSDSPAEGPHHLQVWDLGREGSGADRFLFEQFSGRAATDCSPLLSSPDNATRMESGDVVVNDAMP